MPPALLYDSDDDDDGSTVRRNPGGGGHDNCSTGVRSNSGAAAAEEAARKAGDEGTGDVQDPRDGRIIVEVVKDGSLGLTIKSVDGVPQIVMCFSAPASCKMRERPKSVSLHTKASLRSRFSALRSRCKICGCIL